jgi:hypothetical protein
MVRTENETFGRIAQGDFALIRTVDLQDKDLKAAWDDCRRRLKFASEMAKAAYNNEDELQNEGILQFIGKWNYRFNSGDHQEALILGCTTSIPYYFHSDVDAGFMPMEEYKDESRFLEREARCFDISVVFRGKNIETIPDMLDFLPVKTSEGDGLYPTVKRLHKGVYDIFQQIWPELASKITEVLNLLEKGVSQVKVFVTGHSLGGALATLAAIAIESTFQCPVQLFTFSAPAFCLGPVSLDSTAIRQMRFVMDDDPLCNLSEKLFSHVGNQRIRIHGISFGNHSYYQYHKVIDELIAGNFGHCKE